MTTSHVDTTDVINSARRELMELGAIVDENSKFLTLNMIRLYGLGMQLVFSNGKPCFIETKSLDQTTNMIPYTSPIIPVQSLATYHFIKIKSELKSEIYYVFISRSIPSTV
jgi:hypothetical protein